MSRPLTPKLFVRTEDAWRAMYADIADAQSSVYLEMYIFNKNGAPYDFADLLVRKTQSGVAVRVIIDAWAIGQSPEMTINTLRKGGVQVSTFYSWFRRLHRKLLIVDERVAYVGGVNFSRSSKAWEDLVLRLEEPIVAALVRSFHRLEQTTDPLHMHSTALYTHASLKAQKVKMWLVEHVSGVNHISASYYRLIREAQHEINIVTPYFMPRRAFLHQLTQAVTRGVQVTVLVPKNTDQYIADRINHRYMRLLQGSGIHFFLQPHMNHGKAMVVDGHIGILGSHNFDMLSLEINDELGVAFSDQQLIRKLLAQIEIWKNQSEPYDRTRARRHIIDWFLFPFIALFRMF